MTIPSPKELGFPPKFVRWRPNQATLLAHMLGSTRRFKAACMPTGGGKTAVYVAYALITGHPTCIVTESRGLQDQLMADFSGVGLVDIRGRRNYTCPMKDDYTCEEGYATKCPYKGGVNCPASEAEIRAALSTLVVTNYDKWTSSHKFGQGMSHFTQVIFDEGHESPFALARAIQITLSTHELNEMIDLDRPDNVEEMVSWKVWAAAARAQTDIELAQWRREITQPGRDVKATWVRHYLHLRNLSKRLATLATCRAENWVVDTLDKDKGYVFDPIRVGAYAESYLFLDIPSIVLISATMRQKTLWMVGVGKVNYDYWEFKSEFPATRCPIYYVPTLRVDRRATDLSALWLKLDQVAAQRQDRKGIVHSVSFARQGDVLATSRFQGVMLLNERGEASAGVIADYRGARAGAILVSPSVGAGYDFPGTECEWQFICKIPFPNTSKIIKARQIADPEYGMMIAAQKLEQMCGRHMRYATDQGETIIVDSHMDWFYPRYSHLFSHAFRERYREVATLPQPPARLEV